MTKTTLGNAFDTVTMLDEIRAKSSDIRVRYWCHRNVDILLDDYDYFLKKRNGIIEHYCYKDEHGTYGTLNEDGRVQFNVNKKDMPEFIQELNELNGFVKSASCMCPASCNSQTFTLFFNRVVDLISICYTYALKFP